MASVLLTKNFCENMERIKRLKFFVATLCEKNPNWLHVNNFSVGRFHRIAHLNLLAADQYFGRRVVKQCEQEQLIQIA